MITFGTVNDINPSTQENWMIVRSPDELFPFAKHMPELSPSPELFQSYRKAVHSNSFTEEWFEKHYVPQFLLDLTKNSNAMNILSELTKRSNNTDFYLCCYCVNEKMCHRSIIAGILLGLGASIDTSPIYRKYYDMFIQLL